MRPCGVYRETVRDGGDDGFMVVDVDDEAGDGIGGVELGDGSVEDGESGDVETFEEYLADEFVGRAGNTWEEGEEDWGFILDATQSETREEGVFPVLQSISYSVRYDSQNENAKDRGSRKYQSASAWIQSETTPSLKGHEMTRSCPAASASSSCRPTR